MFECFQGGRFVELPDGVERPEGLECDLTCILCDQQAELRSHCDFAAVSDQALGRLSRPLVRIGEELDQISGAQPREIERLFEEARPASRRLSR